MAKDKRTANLSERQRQYIWLMGSFRDRIAKQGRGKRTPKLMYGFWGEDELIIFGYSSPFLWLTNRELVRRLDNDRSAYVLTDLGERYFQRMVINGDGMRLNQHIQKVDVK